MSDPYLLANLQRVCAEDEAIAEQGVDVVESAGVYVLTGRVTSEEHRRRIEQRVVAELAGHPVRNEITVASADPPSGAEEIA